MPLKLKEGEQFDDKQNAIKLPNSDNALDEKNDLGEEDEFLGEGERFFRPRNRVSRCQFFRYMAQIRGTDWHRQHWLWKWGQLAQLYTISFNNRIEAERVQYIKRLYGRLKLITPASIMNMLKKYRDGQGVYYLVKYSNKNHNKFKDLLVKSDVSSLQMSTSEVRGSSIKKNTPTA